MAETISPDYLVIGAGAMGLAFVDTIISDTESTVALVDRYAQPGGHWTITYPYVRLHQPSACYGVNSRNLGEMNIDEVGFNKGLFELATGSEVCGYYNNLMQQTLLPSGRVTWYSKHDYIGDGHFKSLLTGRTYQVAANTRIVDATYMKVEVPVMRPPPFHMSEGVNVIPPNDLTKIGRPYSGYTVVGGGKTGIDACLWLTTHGVPPDKISWIIPRDMWYFDRATQQPGPRFAEAIGRANHLNAEAVMTATSPDDLLSRLGEREQLLRLDPNVTPTMWKCATVTKMELEQIRKISNVIRQGHLLRVSRHQMELEKGMQVPASPDTLYIDCTSSSLRSLPVVPVFAGKHITLQPMRMCQQVFSAALIAHIATTYTNDEQLSNKLCAVVPHPDEANEWIRQHLQTFRNELLWKQYPETDAWLARCRLDLFRAIAPKVPEDPREAEQFDAGREAGMMALIKKLEWLQGQLPVAERAGGGGGGGEERAESKL